MSSEVSERALLRRLHACAVGGVAPPPSSSPVFNFTPCEHATHDGDSLALPSNVRPVSTSNPHQKNSCFHPPRTTETRVGAVSSPVLGMSRSTAAVGDVERP